jgi:hypothetical protein
LAPPPWSSPHRPEHWPRTRRASALNPQALHAQDVLPHPLRRRCRGLALMQREVIAAINALTAEVAAAAGDRSRIYEAAQWQHLHAPPRRRGNSSHPRQAPYAGTHWRLPSAGHVLGLAIALRPGLPPVISAYVGADLTAGIQATDSAGEGEPSCWSRPVPTAMVLGHGGRLPPPPPQGRPSRDEHPRGMRAGGPSSVCARRGRGRSGWGHWRRVATGICGSGLPTLWPNW